MSSFKKVDTKVFGRRKEVTAESLYWKKFGDPILLKEFGPVDYLNFSPVEPYNFAVTSSARVQVYNPVTKTSYKNLNKFKVTAYGGSFRQDGRLLCAGSEDSVVRLFDVSARSLLRRFKGHTGSVHRTFFTSDNVHIASFSDDKSVILWDIVTEQQVVQFKEHSDYVRAGSVSPINANVVLSGGYDGVVKVYDGRDKSVVCSLDHGAPVESCLFLSSGSIFITAGGKEVRIWDAFTRTLLTRCGQYHKTVTCMCLSRNGKRLLTGSLDHRVKVIDLVSYKVVHSMTYTSPILSIAASNDDKTLVTGSVNGLVTIQKRSEPVDEPAKKRVPFKYVSDTSAKGSSVIDTYVLPVKKDVMAKHEQALRKFQYSKALDCVMINQIAFKWPHVVVTVFDELIRRKGLHHALSDRNPKQLAMILRFLVKYICVERYMNVLIKVADCIIDTYCDSIDTYSAEVKKMFGVLHSTAKREVEITQDLLQLQGSLEMIFAAASFTLTQPIEKKCVPSENVVKEE